MWGREVTKPSTTVRVMHIKIRNLEICLEIKVVANEAGIYTFDGQRHRRIQVHVLGGTLVVLEAPCPNFWNDALGT